MWNWIKSSVWNYMGNLAVLEEKKSLFSCKWAYKFLNYDLSGHVPEVLMTRNILYFKRGSRAEVYWAKCFIWYLAQYNKDFFCFLLYVLVLDNVLCFNPNFYIHGL